MRRPDVGRASGSTYDCRREWAEGDRREDGWQKRDRSLDVARDGHTLALSQGRDYDQAAEDPPRREPLSGTH